MTIPPDYRADILLRLSSGESLTSVCDTPGYPDRVTVQRLVRSDARFCEDYRLARQCAADLLVDQIIEIADSATPDDVAVARERISARKWLGSKLLPEQYGDRIQHSGEVTFVPLQISRESTAHSVAATAPAALLAARSEDPDV